MKRGSGGQEGGRKERAPKSSSDASLLIQERVRIARRMEAGEGRAADPRTQSLG